jgi:hypothetical protein
MSGRILFTVAAIAGLAFVPGNAVAAGEPNVQHVTHQMPGPAHVELKTSEVIVPMDSFGGRPVVSLRIEGKGPYRFVLDTGAGGSVMKEGLGETLALETLGEARVASPTESGSRPGTVAPHAAGKLMRIGRLEMGDATLTGLPIVATDLSRVFPSPGDPAGVLSAQAFAGYLVTFDYPGQRIRLTAGSLPDPNGSDLFEYEAGQHIPTIRISVAGVPVQAHLDSGSGRGLMLPASFATRIPLSGPLVDAGKARTVDGEMPLRQAAIAGVVTFGRFGVENPTVSFAEGATIANIGYEILRRFVITMDPQNRRFRLEEMAAPAGTGSAG